MSDLGDGARDAETVQQSNEPTSNEWWCHQCETEIQPIDENGTMVCPECGGDFIESIDTNNDPRNFHSDGSEEYEDDEAGSPTRQHGLLVTLMAQMMRQALQGGGELGIDAMGPGGRAGAGAPAAGHRDGRSSEEHERRPGSTRDDASSGREGSRRGVTSESGDEDPAGAANHVGDEGDGGAEGEIGSGPRSAGLGDEMPPGLNEEQQRAYRRQMAVYNQVAELLQTLMGHPGGGDNPMLNFMPMVGNPGDYVFSQQALDSIVTQLMEQNAGSNAPARASEEAINNLRRVYVRGKDLGEHPECAVCQDEFSNEGDGELAVRLECTHHFHPACIENWLRVNGGFLDIARSEFIMSKTILTLNDNHTIKVHARITNFKLKIDKEKFKSEDNPFLVSQRFGLPGWMWELRLHPRGDGPDNSGHISIYLAAVRSDREIAIDRTELRGAERGGHQPTWTRSVKYTISIPRPRTPNSGDSENVFSGTSSNVFESQVALSWGWKKYLDRSRLEEALQPDGSLLLNVEVKGECPPGMALLDLEPLKTASLDEREATESGHLLFSPLLSDVEFRVYADGEDSQFATLPAHRQILALRSEYWRTMFTSGLRESKAGRPGKHDRRGGNTAGNSAGSSSSALLKASSAADTGPEAAESSEQNSTCTCSTVVVDILDVSLNSFKSMCEFLYTSKLDKYMPKSREEKFDVLMVADRYQLANEILRPTQRLNVTEVLDLLTASSLYGGGDCTGLKQVCLNFAKSRLADLKSDPEAFRAWCRDADRDLLADLLAGHQKKQFSMSTTAYATTTPRQHAYILSNEWFQLIEWDSVLQKSSNMLGISLNVIYLLIKIYRGEAFTDEELIEYTPKTSSQRSWWSSSKKSSKSPIVSDDDDTLTSTSFFFSMFLNFDFLMSIMEVMIILISIANALVLVNNSKTYTLLHQPTKPSQPDDTTWKIKSRNARLVLMDLYNKLPSTECDSDDDESEGEERETTLDSGNPFKTPSKSKSQQSKASGTYSARLSSVLSSASKGLLWSSQKGKKSGRSLFSRRTSAPKSKMELRWILRVWNPPTWSISLFCWLSPPTVAVFYCMNSQNWFYMTLLALLLDGTMYMIMQAFQDRLADQEIIHTQLHREYNQFVYSLPPFRTTQSMGVGGDEPWSNDE
ncbi:hypothetical protein HDU76_002892 [Blyttiomyces sp. JEL0837]|nr:hypothetical protein HDU76_002892 [Blyttiomyces sp. JEL0837]